MVSYSIFISVHGYFVFIDYINKISEAHVFISGKFIFFRILGTTVFILFMPKLLR